MRRVEMGEHGRYQVAADEPAVIAYYFSHLAVAHGRRERFVRALARALPAAARPHLLSRRRWAMEVDDRGLPTPPASAGTSSRGEPPSPHALLARAFGEAPAEMLAGTPLAEAREVRWILWAAYPHRRSQRAHALAFHRGRGTPAAVAKIHHRAGETAQLRREWDALQEVRKRLPPALRDTIPAPWRYHEAHGTELLVLGPVPGRSAYVEMRGAWRPRRTLEVHLRRAGRWLAGFHTAGRSANGAPFDPRRARAKAAQMVGGEVPLGDAWEAAMERCCAAQPLALVWSHGDFWARNLLVDGGGAMPSVVDWEQFEATAAPFDDLFHFALTYGLAFRWSDGPVRDLRRAFERAFFTPNPVSRAVREYLLRYCRDTGLDSAALRPALQLWVLTGLRRLPASSLRVGGTPREDGALGVELCRRAEALAGAWP